MFFPKGEPRLTTPFNNKQTLKFKAQPTNVFRYRQSNVRRLLPASDYCGASGNQIIEHSSDNMADVLEDSQCTAVVGSWEEPPNI